MNRISVARLGLASGSVATLAYIACAAAMRFLPLDVFTYLANAYLHGVDITSVMNPGIPWYQALIGIALTFVTAWGLAALLALIYNRGVSPSGMD